MMDFQVNFKLEYETRNIAGKIMNVRGVRTKEIAETEFLKHAEIKYKNAVNIRVIEIKEIY